MKNQKSVRTFSTLALLAIISYLPLSASAQLETLLQQPLMSVDNSQFTLLRITLPPLTGNNDSANGHRHPVDTIVYVESGTVTNQMNDEAVKTYKAGESWVENPGDLHAQFRNNDPDIPAVVIVFMLTEPGDPLTSRD